MVKHVYQQAEEHLKKFGTDRVRGLSSEGVRKNAALYGENRLTPPEKDPLWKQYIEKFADPTIIILCICAAIAVGIGFYRGEIPWDGFAIFAAVMIATAGGTYSEYKADKAFELLKKDSDDIPVKAWRDGQLHEINSANVVVGDLIQLEAGDKIPADAVLLHSIDLMVDESLMTGEPPVHKGAQDTQMCAGTFTIDGSGLAVVTCVGDNTELGNLASALGKGYVCSDSSHLKIHKEDGVCQVCNQPLVERKEATTPLQEKLGVLAGLISVWGTYAAVFIFLALLGSSVLGDKMGVLSATWKMGLVYVTGATLLAALFLLVPRKPQLTRLALWGTAIILGSAYLISVVAHASASNWLEPVKLVLDFFMIAVTIVVVAVPEGLPMAVTIALGCSMRKIREDNNLVRKMLATETIGSVTCICTDKTGTLTKNQMAVQEVYIYGQHLHGNAVLTAKESPMFDLLSLACSVNSTAAIEHAEDGQVRSIGNPTEGALLTWLERQGIEYQALRDRMPIHSRACFTADRKMMSTLSGNDACTQCAGCPMDKVDSQVSSVVAEKDGCRIIFSKGAPDRIIPQCEHAFTGNGRIRPMDECREDIMLAVATMAAKAVRPLAIACRIHKRHEVEPREDIAHEMESNLTLLAVIGISDPVREDVPLAVDMCRKAGIEVKMVTGDHAATAEAIARQIGMIDADSVIMRGEDFEAKSDEELTAVLGRLRVLARARPLDKERLVVLLQRQGNVVAVTGDGSNDAPALRTADVGISMGVRGTEVAKQASDIVLMDDNFGSIVRAVHWGRTLYENLQKFLQFQLTVNFSALGIALLSPILAILFPSVGFKILPLTVLQYLWINLIMDTLGALAFGLEPPRPESMMMKPKSRNESFVNKTMKINIVSLGTYFIVLLVGLQLYTGLNNIEPALGASLIFNSFVWFQIFNMFNARCVIPGRGAFAGLSKSRSFFYIMGGIIVVQCLLVTFGGTFMHTSPLPVSMWIASIGLGATVLLVGAVVRMFQRVTLTEQPKVVAAKASA